MERQIALNSHIGPFPEKELCDYEKLRERNIKEREQGMEESGFFEDLMDFKKRLDFSQISFLVLCSLIMNF